MPVCCIQGLVGSCLLIQTKKHCKRASVSAFCSKEVLAREVVLRNLKGGDAPTEEEAPIEPAVRGSCW